MNGRLKRRIIIVGIILIVMMCDITYTKDNKYTRVNNMVSVLLIKKPLIEKGIITENEN